ncbi:helix-turn-helix transcriptional regulator [Cellulomonas pakistanensis]|uniref:XRE family transcriptional regulator n=1 Tax=Cellulomonas pakistanensis TaxID=992287 RepID=A0A919U7E4_9CELL|nr:helix-turn-helix transcriptional regulator [Cellulomonas pakistanensis]GIG37929.1 XRE family transcriptional regulator [Cellulomonas pakistanensis]
MDRDALADFLLRHRQALRPGDVGLPPGARRRAPGLRREEVAQLAVMSTDYYTRLEQRRGPQPSTQMLGSLARALRLTPDERDYLYRVAGHSAPDRAAREDYVAPGLLRVLDRITDSPALVLDGLGRTLVQNDLARALFGPVESLAGWERSAIYRWFASPGTERLLYPEDDRDRQSRAQVASLRATLGAEGPRSRAAELVRELSARSAEFVALWEAHEVSRRFEDHKVLIHPRVGAIEVDCQALFTEDGSQTLLVLTAAPRSEAESRLRLLAVLGTQQFAAQDG